MGELAKTLIMFGALLVLLLFQKIPFLGKLPGDIIIKNEKFTFTFPLATSIVISVIISLILYLIGKFR